MDLLPFETIGDDGRVYMHYDNWTAYREDWIRNNPKPEGQFRFDLELVTPHKALEDVPIDHFPHDPPHRCYYECPEWDIVLGPFDAHHPSGESLRMVVESGCILGREPVVLLGTSCSIEDEPWGRNKANKFVQYRGLYWYVKWHQFLQPWVPPITYPLVSPKRSDVVYRVLDRWLIERFGARPYDNGAIIRCGQGCIDITYDSQWSAPAGWRHKRQSIQCVVQIDVLPMGDRDLISWRPKMVVHETTRGPKRLTCELCDPQSFERIEKFVEEAKLHIS